LRLGEAQRVMEKSISANRNINENGHNFRY